MKFTLCYFPMHWKPRTVFIEYDIIPCSKSPYLLWGPHSKTTWGILKGGKVVGV